MNFPEVYTAILSGDLDEDLDGVVRAVNDRRRIMGDINSVTMKVGDKVQLQGLSPKSLNGLVGHITKTPSGRSKRFDVKLLHEIVLRHRVTDVVHGIPVQCVVKMDD
jgi:sulfate adenylyltransferase subunit 1 (EFTu-like GTPase family)